MAAHDYSFVTLWRMPGTCELIQDILMNAKGFERWWPSVYLKIDIVSHGAPNGVGAIADLHTKGWLPYTLRWRSTLTAVNRPHGFSLRATGDFDGTGEWTFEQQGHEVAIRFDWRIQANKPLLRIFSGVFKPIFSANHRWAMAQGETCLRRELERLAQSSVKEW